jgi:hypothetical protein
MIKRCLSFGVVAIGLMAILVSTIHAYPSRPGGWGVSPYNSLLVWSEWLGVAKPEVSPTEIKVSLQLTDVTLFYFNPGGNGGGLSSHNFNPNLTLEGEDVPDSDSVSKSGKYYSEIIFENSQLIQGVISSPDFPEPPNDQWTLDEEKIQVNQMYVTIIGYSDINPEDGTADFETAYVLGFCELNYDGTAYHCTTLDTWGYKKNDQYRLD